jgi:uncharacterized protein HemX
MEEQVLEKHLKKTVIVSNLLSVSVAIIAAISCGYGFYYTTNGTLENHSTEIKEVRQDIGAIKNEISNTAVFKGASVEKLHGIEDRISKMEQTQVRMEEKQDRVLEMLSTIRNNTAK